MIHIPFKKEPLKAAITTYSHDQLPKGALSYYNKETYQKWGIIQQ